MSVTVMLTLTFLAIGAPLYIAVGVIGAEEVRGLRHDRLVRRHTA